MTIFCKYEEKLGLRQPIMQNLLHDINLTLNTPFTIIFLENVLTPPLKERFPSIKNCLRPFSMTDMSMEERKWWNLQVGICHFIIARVL